jgi:uncharacterized integral membrane protein
VAGPAPTTPDPIGKRKRPEWKIWAAITSAILLVIFVGLNSQEVEVNFIFGTAQSPLIVALLIAGGLGALIGWLIPRVRRGGKSDA